MSPNTSFFVALLKLKADVIKDMFQQDIAHRTCPRTVCGLEKGFKRNSMFFFQITSILKACFIRYPCQDMT